MVSRILVLLAAFPLKQLGLMATDSPLDDVSATVVVKDPDVFRVGSGAWVTTLTSSYLQDRPVEVNRLNPGDGTENGLGNTLPELPTPGKYHKPTILQSTPVKNKNYVLIVALVSVILYMMPQMGGGRRRPQLQLPCAPTLVA